MFPEKNKDQIANDLELDLLAQPKPKATPKAEVAKEQPQAIPEKIADNATTQVVNILTEFISQQNQENKRQAQQQAQQSALEIEARYKNQSGGAIQAFIKKMDQEIENGDYSEWPYFNQQDITGAFLTITINGYSMTFVNGETTAVPNSLKKQVEQYFRSVSKTKNSLQNIMVSSTSHLGGPVDAKATQDVINEITNKLPHR